MKTKPYLTPACKEVVVEIESVLCASIQSQDFNDLETLEME